MFVHYESRLTNIGHWSPDEKGRAGQERNMSYSMAGYRGILIRVGFPEARGYVGFVHMIDWSSLGGHANKQSILQLKMMKHEPKHQ